MYHGASPMQVLGAAGAGVPGFVIYEINSLLAEAMKDASGPQLLLAKQIVMAKLAKAGRENGIDYNKNWLNFPIYYLRDWDVVMPHDEYGYYRFTPKGLTV